MTSLIFNSKILIDFAKCVEKSISKPDYVYFILENGKLYVSSAAYDAAVFLEVTQFDAVDIKVGVSAEEFIRTVTKFNEDDLKLSISSKKVGLSIGNVSISYATVVADWMTPHWYPPDGSPVRGEDLSWFLDSLVKCGSSVDTIFKDDLRFRDILLCGDGFTHMVRITEAAVQVCASQAMQFRDRLVIPSSLVKFIKAFKPSIETCFGGEKGVIFWMTYDFGEVKANLRSSFLYVVDNYPRDCLSFLNLNKTLPLMNTNKQGYRFQRDHLVQALDLVSSAVKDESQVRFEIIGKQEGGDPVWKLSSGNYKGTSCEELVSSSSAGSLTMDPFSLHGKKAIKALESYGETVIFYNHSRSTIALADDSGNDLTLLSKGAG